MRQVVLDPYSRDDGRATNYPPQMYLVLYQAVLGFTPGEDKKEAQRAEELLDILEHPDVRTVEDEGTDKEAAYLNPKGCVLTLEDATFDTLKKAWIDARKGMQGRFSRLRNRIEDLLEHAPKYTAKEWEQLTDDDDNGSASD